MIVIGIDPGLARVPVVAFSGFDYPSERSRAQAAGQDPRRQDE